MPFVDLQSEIKQGTLCWADRWNVTLRIMGPDRIAENGSAPFFVFVQWSPPRADAQTVITFRRLSETGGKITFDAAGNDIQKTIVGDTAELVTIYGKNSTPASEADVSLEIRVDDKVRGSTYPMSVGPVTESVAIKAENGIDDPPAFVLRDYAVKYNAVASVGPGTYRWLSTSPPALVVTGGESERISEIEARGAIASRRQLCVLFSPDSGPAVMGIHEVAVWSVAHPENPGSYSVGRLHYGDNDRIQVLGDRANYLSQWGSSGGGAGQFNHPAAIAADHAGVVYVVDKDNHRIQKFSPTGDLIAQWGGSGSAEGEFDRPGGIAVDANGNIFVTDTGNHRIQKFDRNGGFASSWGSGGSGDGEFDEPFGIAVDNAGHCYVTDRNNHRIQKFSDTGAFVAKWGSAGAGDGGFNHPAGIVVDQSNHIYAVDEDNHRVQKFTNTGAFVAKWGTAGGGDGEFDHPIHITADNRGHVYVTDRDNHRIQKFSNSGTFRTSWGTSGSGDGEFNLALGIAINRTNTIYVTDSGNHRVQRFSFLRQWGHTGSLDGEMMSPAGLAMTSGGELLVADRYNNRIQRFNPATGTFISAWGVTGTGGGELIIPWHCHRCG